MNSKRQTEVRLNIPRELAAAEPGLRKQIMSDISRGNLTVTVTYQLTPSLRRERIRVDHDMAAAVVRELHILAEEHGVDPTIRAGDLLLVPGLVSETAVDPPPIVADLVTEALDIAIRELRGMQETEGKTLRADLAGRSHTIRESVGAVSQAVDATLVQYRDRLRERIRVLDVELPVDDDRLAKEVAFLAERSDITEELVRLTSHLDQFDEQINDGAAQGRNLEFLCQEMGREANTLCAKAADTKIAELGLRIKGELGRVREQVQNVQ